MSGSSELDFSKKYQQVGPETSFKPAGLWYSLDNEWVEWCESNMPEWVKPNHHILNLEESRLCVIDSLDSLSEFEASLRQVCRIEPITGAASAAIEVGKVKIEFDLTGAIDVVAERARLTKDLATAEKDRQTAKVKLENEGFMAKAPIEVVKEIRDRLAQTSADIESITAQLAALPTK